LTHSTTMYAEHSETLSFLQSLFSGAEGKVLIWTLGDKVSRFFNASDLDAAAEYATARSGETDVYLGVGTRKDDLGPRLRGGAEEVCELAGVFLDIDIRDACHSNTRLPATEDEAMEFLSAMPFEPTTVIHSGHGLQAWWLFEQAIPLAGKDERDHASGMLSGWVALANTKAAGRGWKFDSVGDLARVMRIPGTMNRKAEPVAVKTLSNGGRRYNPMDILETIKEDEQTTTLNRANETEMVSLKTVTPGYDDANVLSMAEKKHGGRFTRLFYKGDVSAFGGDASRADLSLCDLLAFASDDPTQVDRLFRSSALMRPKWDEKHSADGSTYGDITVAKAIQAARESRYSPERVSTPTGAGGVKITQILGADGSSLDDCLKTADPANAQKTEMVGGMFPKGYVSIMYGEPGSGKSLIAQRLAADLSAGLAPLGGYALPEEPMPVLFIEGDSTSNLMNERFRCTRWQYDPDNLKFVYPMESLGWDFSIDQERGRQNIELLVAKRRPELVVFDTLTSLAGMADEISNKEMRPLFLFAAHLANTHDTSVLVIHHARKCKREDMGKPLTLSDVSGAGTLGRLSGQILAVEARTEGDVKILTVRTVKTWWAGAPEFSVELAQGYWDDDTFPRLDMRLTEQDASKRTKGGQVKETVLSDFRESTFTRRDIQRVMSGAVSGRMIRNTLSEMVQKGEIESIGDGAGRKYRLPHMGGDIAGLEEIR